MEYFSVANLQGKIRDGDYIGQDDCFLSKVCGVNENSFAYDSVEGQTVIIDFKKDANRCFAWIPNTAIGLLNQFLVQLYTQRAYENLLTDKYKTVDRMQDEINELKDKLNELSIIKFST